MATPAAAGGGWYRARVKAVPSGDSLVITALSNPNPGPPREKTLTLSSIITPRLVIILYLQCCMWLECYSTFSNLLPEIFLKVKCQQRNFIGL